VAGVFVQLRKRSPLWKIHVCHVERAALTFEYRFIGAKLILSKVDQCL
jgi:hypothetical protein